jgi:hypothetical protein
MTARIRIGSAAFVSIGLGFAGLHIEGRSLVYYFLVLATPTPDAFPLVPDLGMWESEDWEVFFGLLYPGGALISRILFHLVVLAVDARIMDYQIPWAGDILCFMPCLSLSPFVSLLCFFLSRRRKRLQGDWYSIHESMGRAGCGLGTATRCAKLA